MEIPCPTHISSLLRSSIQSHDVLAGKSIHAHVIKLSLTCNVYLMNNLVNFYAKTGFSADAHNVLDEMPVKTIFSWNTVLSGYAKQGNIEKVHCLLQEIPDPDSVSWTTMIVGYNRIGYFDNALKTFAEMVKDKVLPTQFTLTNLLASAAAIGSLSIGRKVHSFVVKLGLSECTPVANSLLNMYAKTGNLGMAKVIFNRMQMRDTSSWNHMISLHMHSGRVDLARSQFEQMSERDMVTWNSMIAGCCQHGFEEEAIGFFSCMLKDSSLKPDRFTLASVLSACSNLGKLNFGKQVHGHIVRTEFDAYEVVKNALVSMYAKCGVVEIARRIVERSRTLDLDIIASTALLDGYIKLGDMVPARQIFNSLRDLDVVAWTAMIVGYVQHGSYSDAIELFRRMVREGPQPNSYTLAAILSGITTVASLNHGKEIHASAIRSVGPLSLSVGNALITMYAKAGSINGARQVFNLIRSKRDSVSWTSMIIGFAQHGHGEEALELFEEMLALGIYPDQITYVGVLSACTHVGLVEKGRNYYNLMKNQHKIEPTLSLYACMVDLFGRAGLLQEAYDFIGNMPIEPDVITWGSLLSSCKKYKNADLAEVAADRLLSIDPDNSGAYAALANVYSACGKWENAARVRKLMKDRGVKKDQGFSWLQIQNKVHVFRAEDGHHPQKDEIYKKMDQIWKEIKDMGFVPDVASVLHNLEVEVKDQILRYHSEKLAIAFGLLNTPENSTLRIMKNLRVCIDCHTAIKFISKLVGREIIVRDATRFHHFKDGSCSCREYW